MHGCLHQINFRYSPWNMSHVKGIRMTGMYLKTFANDLCNGPSIGNSNLHGFQIFQYILFCGRSRLDFTLKVCQANRTTPIRCPLRIKRKQFKDTTWAPTRPIHTSHHFLTYIINLLLLLFIFYFVSYTKFLLLRFFLFSFWVNWMHLRKAKNLTETHGTYRYHQNTAALKFL